MWLNLWGKSYFIPTNTTIMRPWRSQVILTECLEVNGLPSQYMSDHGLQFVAEFTKSYTDSWNITYPVTTHTTHIRWTDGHVNQELEQYLQIFVNERQDYWMNTAHGRIPVQQPIFTLALSKHFSSWVTTHTWALSSSTIQLETLMSSC